MTLIAKKRAISRAAAHRKEIGHKGYSPLFSEG